MSKIKYCRKTFLEAFLEVFLKTSLKALLISLMIPMILMILIGSIYTGHAQSHAVNAGKREGFAVRAFHLDMRIQVMTLPALEAFAQKLHDAGINTLIMEYEANYPYEQHPLIPGRYAYTKEEIVSLVSNSRLGMLLVSKVSGDITR